MNKFVMDANESIKLHGTSESKHDEQIELTEDLTEFQDVFIKKCHLSPTTSTRQARETYRQPS
jgi:hypothetical protein